MIISTNPQLGPSLKEDTLLGALDIGRAISKIQRREDRSISHTLNIISEGFLGSGETIPSRRRYAHQVMIVEGLPIKTIPILKKVVEPKVTYFAKGSR